MDHLKKLTDGQLQDLLVVEQNNLSDALFDEAFFSWSKAEVKRNKTRIDQAKKRVRAIKDELDGRGVSYEPART